ncbi:MAG: hypothetical protein IJZ35_06520 [Clostridia bacterium]|nr:hypothetical protein [Clostridia bacterium]
MKKLATVSLAIILLIVFQSFAYAENADKTYRTGLIWDTWDDIIEYATEPDSGLDIYEMSIRRKCDINGDGQITSADARMCLRTSAELEELSYQQTEAADVNADEKITSADARKILRISAGLDEQIANTIEMTTDWGFIFGSLRPAGSGRYIWTCTADDGLTVTENWRNDRVVNPGDTADQFFIFSAEETGTYNVHFELKASWENMPIDEFDITVVVKQ